jgi:cyclopropane fatty-acyl-phospholipid synthase-like methyltransferase
MKKGFKYYYNLDSRETVELPVDADIESFSKTMRYEKQDWKIAQAMLDSIMSKHWIMELHEAVMPFLDKNRTLLGIGSGEGEHELLLHLKGYNVVASDIIPGLTEKTQSLFPEFQCCTFDVFKDDIDSLPICNTAFDILVTGLDFYFDDVKAKELFKRFYELIPDDGTLIFVLRYRQSIFTTIIDFLSFVEVYVQARKKKAGIFKKHHGYRRTKKDVLNLAKEAGFHAEKSVPAMLGYECGRVRFFNSHKLTRICAFTDRLIPLFHSAIVFKFIKKL